MTAQISSQVDSQLANTTPITENDLPVSETEQPNENKGDEPSSEIMEVIRQNEARITKLTVDLLKAETALEQALQQKKVEMELRQEQVKDLQSEMAKMSISSIPSDDPQVKNLHYLRQQFKDEKTSEE